MTQFLLIGIGAGATTALLYASLASGLGLSLTLHCLAPLPIMIVALGWSHWAGLIAAVTAAAMLAAAIGGVLGIFFFAAFLTSIGAPAWWLGYLALLGRPVANNGAAQMEWYPPGRLVLWAAVLGAAVTASALAALGTDEATIRQELKGALDQILRVERVVQIRPVLGPQVGVPADAPQSLPDTQGPTATSPGAPVDSVEDFDRAVDLLAHALPPAAAVLAALTQIGNLWLAGLVVRLSGRLRRPWPDLTALSFPPLAVGAYGTCLAGLFLGGLPALVASLFAATLTMAFAMIGLAVVHTATRDMRGRTVFLWGTYGAVFLLILPLTIVGVTETLFDLRGRMAKSGPPNRRGPPTNQPETDN